MYNYSWRYFMTKRAYSIVKTLIEVTNIIARAWRAQTLGKTCVRKTEASLFAAIIIFHEGYLFTVW